MHELCRLVLGGRVGEADHCFYEYYVYRARIPYFSYNTHVQFFGNHGYSHIVTARTGVLLLQLEKPS